jgi:4-amino-4-deoxy-L-arabinose transferase-like glycosyltransferase
VQTKTESSQQTPEQAKPTLLRRIFDRRLLLLLALALLAGILSYQAPLASEISVGWLGDRLFLRASEGAGAQDSTTFYGDEHNPEAYGARSRWTRQTASFSLPGLGLGKDLTLTLSAQGWPADVLNQQSAQPTVTVLANEQVIGEFVPTGEWADYHFTISAADRSVEPLIITLQMSDVFTHTEQYVDTRPKGIRLSRLLLSETPEESFTWPAWRIVLLMIATAALWLFAITALIRRRTWAFVLTTFLITLLALGLALSRIWAAALLPWVALSAIILWIFAFRSAIWRWVKALIQRYSYGRALDYGVIVLASSILGLLIMRIGSSVQAPDSQIFRDTFPDSLLLAMLLMGLLLLTLVLGRQGLPRVAQGIANVIGGPRSALVLLGIFLAIWIGYEAAVVWQLPYVGHADYADNAVVARNLAQGRGWVVDYVTQFYRLYDGVTRPQETWPMLQPVWMAPFFWLFGPENWAAKIPNLIFMTALGILVFIIGSRLWDRRVGLFASIIVLTSHLFFKLMIYATTDLAFVVFSMAAIFLVYRYAADEQQEVSADLVHVFDHAFADRKALWRIVWAGIFTGFMLLQKPGSSAIIAFGMGLWFLAQQWRRYLLRRKYPNPPSFFQAVVKALVPVALWTVIALAILSPYMIRNLNLFGTPFYSTETYDAWIQGYTNSWEIYKVYTPERGLGETGGLPDQSWLLRWGFDRTFHKFSQQTEAVRDYLLPPWPGLPFDLSGTIFGRSDKSPLLFGVGAWLVLGGLLLIRSRLTSLLFAAYLPYTAFLILYWHADEERYFVMVMPWLALFAAWMIWRCYDRLARIGDSRWAPLGLVVAITALVLIVRPSWPIISEKVIAEPQRYAADHDAYEWLRQWAEQNHENNPVVMTRNPWQFNWETSLPALMVPHTTNIDTFLQIAQYYQVEYLVIDSLQRPPAVIRATLNSLIDQGIVELVYETPVYEALSTEGRVITMTTEIYRFPADYGGVVVATP